MKIKSMLIGVLALSATASPALAESNGAFGAYLVGTMELRYGFGTVLQVVNPTTTELQIVGALYDAQGSYITCGVARLQPNALLEVPIWGLLPPQDEDPELVGVAKIISFREKVVPTHVPPEKEYLPVEGIIGFQRHCNLKYGCSDGNLAALPKAVAEQELAKIVADCPLL